MGDRRLLWSRVVGTGGSAGRDIRGPGERIGKLFVILSVGETPHNETSLQHSSLPTVTSPPGHIPLLSIISSSEQKVFESDLILYLYVWVDLRDLRDQYRILQRYIRFQENFIRTTLYITQLSAWNPDVTEKNSIQ